MFKFSRTKTVITHVSRMGAEVLQPKSSCALIALIDPDRDVISTWGDWKYKYVVKCHDVDPAGKSQHFQQAYQIFTPAQAQQILEFVGQLPKTVKTIVCHCEAGLSRSAAVARFLVECVYGKHGKLVHGRFGGDLYNRHIYRILLDAYTEMAQVGD